MLDDKEMKAPHAHPEESSPRGKGLQLVSTLPLRQLLEKAAQNPDLSEEMRCEAAALMSEDKLSWRRIKPVYTASMKARNGETLQLRDACKGSDIVRDPPAEAVKSPELLARLEKLQKSEEERRYKEMVHDITGHERKAEELRIGGLVTYKDQMSYGVHIIIVMAVFYLIGHLAASRISSKPSMHAAGGLVGLVIAMLMETVLLIIRTSDYSKPGKGRKNTQRARPAWKAAQAADQAEHPSSEKGSAPEAKKDR